MGLVVVFRAERDDRGIVCVSRLAFPLYPLSNYFVSLSWAVLLGLARFLRPLFLGQKLEVVGRFLGDEVVVRVIEVVGFELNLGGGGLCVLCL